MLVASATGEAEARASSCALRPPGVRRSRLAVAPGGRTLWATDTGAETITAFRARDLAPLRSIAVGEAPKGIALTQGGRIALVTTGFYDAPGLAIVDLHARKVLHRVDVGREPGDVALTRDGRHALVCAGTGKGLLLRVDPHAGRLEATLELGGTPRGIAIAADGRHALVALDSESEVAVVDVARHRVVRRIATRPMPFLVAAAPEGDRAYVSHAGLGSRQVSVLDVGSGRVVRTLTVGADPAGLALSPAGRLLVAERGAGTVGIVDPETGHRRGQLEPGGYPRALAVHRRRVFALDEQSGRLTAGRVWR